MPDEYHERIVAAKEAGTLRCDLSFRDGCVLLRDDDGEIVYWHRDEFDDEPTLLDSIVRYAMAMNARFAVVSHPGG